MEFIKPQLLVAVLITALLVACGDGGDDWQTGTPGSGGTGGQKPIDTSPEYTPIRSIITSMNHEGVYQINSSNNYTKITAPDVTNINDYHWLQTQYQRDNNKSNSWIDVSSDNKTLLAIGEWAIANDKKLILHYQENYAETMPNQPLLGKYSILGSPINLTLQGYPSGATAYNMQYMPYQDELILDSVSYPASYNPNSLTIEDLINNYQNQWLMYGETLGGEEPVVYQFKGNSSDQQGTVEFFSLAHIATNNQQNLYPLSTGKWKRININGNDIVIVTPPDEVKKLLIAKDRNDKIFVKQANNTGNVKIGKYYPANQPVNMTWYNQTAMDYILQKGLSSIFYIENQ